MKRRFIVIYAVFFTLMSAVICCIAVRGNGSPLPQYTTEINRLLTRLSSDWDTFSQQRDTLGSSGEDFDYAVINADGELLFYTREDISTSVSAATSRFDIIRDIEYRGETVGRLIVHDPYRDIQKANDRKTAYMIGAMAALMLAVSVGYFIYLRARIVKPFGRLESFAARIAAGDLDAPLEMDRENIFGAFTGSFDIMREELKGAHLREEAAVRSRKELVAELSHDIKTPVSSIRAMTDFLLLVNEDESQRDTLNSINGKAEQIDKLISNLFSATLEELEQLEVRPEELASSELADIIRESDYLKKVTSADVRDCVIYADRLRLEQVIGNIFSNSYKYADTDITVESFFEDGCLVAEFSDSGGGVPDEELELITEKFRRGTNAAGKSGSGIGLYISNYLMERMGGSLSCRNNGEGFTVTLRLKLV